MFSLLSDKSRTIRWGIFSTITANNVLPFILVVWGSTDLARRDLTFEGKISLKVRSHLANSVLLLYRVIEKDGRDLKPL